ncbi:thermonuclease family protein [Thermodesulfobacteriota bacterium]
MNTDNGNSHGIHTSGNGPDQYKNMLGVVFFDGKNMNLELVKAGFAEVYRGKLPEGFDAAPFREVEATARSAKKGIWSLGDQYMSPLKWRKNQGIK